MFGSIAGLGMQATQFALGRGSLSFGGGGTSLPYTMPDGTGVG